MNKWIRYDGLKLGVVCMLVVGIAALTACNGGATGSSGSTDTSSSASTNPPSSSESSADSGARPGTLGSSFEEIVRLAGEEKEMVWWGNTPDEVQKETLLKAFNEQFGIDANIEIVDLGNGDIAPRLVTESVGGQRTVSATNLTQPLLRPLVEQGNIVEKIDYVGLFGGHINKIQESNDNVIEEIQGYGLDGRHIVYGIAYNTNLLSEEAVPKTWDELVEPQWSGKIAIDSELSPLARLAGVLTHEEIMEYAQQFYDNRPNFGRGSSSVVNKVVTGETPLAILSLAPAINAKNSGAPVDIVFPTPLSQVNTIVYFVPQGAPAPNLGALWVAWLSSEGLDLIAYDGAAKARQGEAGPFAEYLEKNNLNPPVESTDDVLEQEVLKQALADFMADKVTE